MSRSNYDKPFYVDVGTSIVAIRCASNHDVIVRYDYAWRPHTLEHARTACDRMNKEAEIGRPRRNCDIGTVEEQIARHYKYCSCRLGDGDDPHGCGHISCSECVIRWAQMEYKEEAKQ